MATTRLRPPLLSLLLCAAALALGNATPVASAGDYIVGVFCDTAGAGLCGCPSAPDCKLARRAPGAPDIAIPNPLPCLVSDQDNPHFFNVFASGGVGTTTGQTGGGAIVVYSTNGLPAGCDALGSDGDNEQGVSGAQMPLVGATCPYAQDDHNGLPITVGHHVFTDVYADNNPGGLDMTWSIGTDGYDAASDINAVGSCVGNGIVSDDPTADPNDCSDSTGANVNILASHHKSASLAVANDGFGSCSAAVDGNLWVFLNVGPYVGTNEGSVLLELNAMDTVYSGQTCVDVQPMPGPLPPTVTPPPCVMTVHTDWRPPTPDGEVGVSLPISGTIADSDHHDD